MSEPLVSVVLPVYNCERYLAEAIESVLGQTYQRLDVIVIDDGSTDGSADVAGRYTPPVRYSCQPNAGVGAALNRGIQMAEGSFLAFLDSDDVWVRGKIARQMAAFAQDPGLDMVFGHVQQFLDPGVRSAGYRAEILPGCSKTAMLVRRDSFSQVGMFGTTWRVGDFADWYLRAIEHGLRGVMLPDVVAKRRIHDANMSIREREHQLDFVRILKASLDRRRQGHVP